MDKRIIAVLTLSTALVGGVVSTSSQPAAASSKWHTGMPKALRGYWHNKSNTLSISSKHVYVLPRHSGASASKVKKVQYKYLGKHTYTYKQYWKSGGSYSNKITLSKSGHSLKFGGIKTSFTRGR